MEYTDEDEIISPSMKILFFWKYFPSAVKQSKEFLTQLFQTS